MVKVELTTEQVERLLNLLYGCAKSFRFYDSVSEATFTLLAASIGREKEWLDKFDNITPFGTSDED